MLEYEHSYEMKFNKPPRLVKKIDNAANYEQLKRAAMKQKQINASINKNEAKNEDTPGRLPPNKRILLINWANFKKKDSVSEKSDKKDEANSTGGF